MGKMEYLVMKTDPATSELINTDLIELGNAAMKLATDAVKLGSLGSGTTLLQWLSCDAAMVSGILLYRRWRNKGSSCRLRAESVGFWWFLVVLYPVRPSLLPFTEIAISLAVNNILLYAQCSYLLILDRTNWRTNMLTSLLVPYIFLTLPSHYFHLLRGDLAKWVAFVTVVVRLFFPQRFPEWLEMPGSMILLLIVAPNFFAHTLRDSWVGVLICLVIGCYLLQEHIRASGGFRNSFTQSHGISNTLGIIILKVYPIWALVVHFMHLQ